MIAKKVVLWCAALLLLASPVAAYQFWDEFLQLMGMQTPLVVTKFTGGPEELVEHHGGVQKLLTKHTGRAKERVEFLRRQSLDESFAEMLDDQQYFEHIPSSVNRSEDILQVLTARTFLKVFQEFSELPREQALAKLHQFSDRAIKEYENALGKSSMGIAAQSENPSLSIHEVFDNVTGRFSITGAKYMVCATMLMAARMGEYELLLHQMDTMQSLVNAYLERMGAGQDSIYRKIAALEDDCIFTVLMYALERKERKEDIDVSPVVLLARDELAPISKDGVPTLEMEYGAHSLPRWDVNVRHYDFLVYYGMLTPGPHDVVEQITVYRFTNPWFGGSGADNIQIHLDEQMQLVIDRLKERLSM